LQQSVSLVIFDLSNKPNNVARTVKTGKDMTIREQYLNLNLQINSQLKAAGVVDKNNTKVIKPLDTFPDSEWKSWVKELMAIRDKLQNEI
jgi:hypothetical protein